MPQSILAARTVTRSDFIGDAGAMEAYWKEWSNLAGKKVWRWETLRERDDVVREPNLRPRGHQEIHFGFLFGIMVEKSSEIPRKPVLQIPRRVPGEQCLHP